MQASEIINPQNDFEHVPNWRFGNGKIGYGLRARCAQCGKTEVVALPHGMRFTCVQVQADKMFRNKHWNIANNRKRDMCPECVSDLRAERERKRAASSPFAPLLKLVKAGDPIDPGAAIPAKEFNSEAKVEIVADKIDGALSREGKRIIFMKLNEVYRDEATGYAAGWSDDRIATDLGVPVQWVQAIRDEDFGPADPVAPLFADLRKIMKDADDAFDKFSVAVDDAIRERTAFENRLNALENRIKALEAHK